MSTPKLLQRPIYGGVFGRGRYFLSTTPAVANGLHVVRFMVIEPSTGAVLSIADSKVEALARARQVIRATEAIAAADAGQDLVWKQESLWQPAELDKGAPPIRSRAGRPVSRRRRDIFQKCSGKCHYCGTVLTLDGAWHIEHMMPRALDGTDDITNLVAACVPCNLAKSDSTAIEFATTARLQR